MNRALVGTCVDFHGYDGKHYTAHVDRISKGIATLTYMVRGRQITAYLDAKGFAERVNQPAPKRLCTCEYSDGEPDVECRRVPGCCDYAGEGLLVLSGNIL